VAMTRARAHINRPIIFSQFAPVNTFNKNFVETIDNKLIAFKIFEVAKAKSLDLLQQQGKEFKIFSNFLESQIDFEIKANDETELKVVDCKLESEIQTEGISFTGKPFGEHKLKPDDKVSVSIEIKKDQLQGIGIGSVISTSGKEIKIKSNIGYFDLVKDGVIVKRLFSTKQYDVQLSVLNKFFANKLPLDTFYKVFHDKDGIEPPEKVDLNFFNPVFQGKDNPQTQAIEKAVGNKNILLIQGPPGTGKTTVITEIVKQLIKRGEKILVTSQTHIAVDNVLERIKDDTQINIARIGNEDAISEFAVEYLFDEATKNFSDKVQKIVDIKIELLNHHNQGKDISQFSKQSFELPLTFDWQNIQNFITLIQNSDLKQTNLMIETLEHWKEVIAKTHKLLINIFLQNLNVLFGTCIGIATNKEIEASGIIFDTVILDEAGKANISETLTAISKAKKIILVGDHKQLPPYLDRERVEYFKKF
jgi:DNA polymerase III delta prime subunit